MFLHASLRTARLLLVSWLLLAGSVGRADDTPSATTQSDEFRADGATVLVFERDLRPILKAHCWHCHGDEPEIRGSLDARLARLLLQGGESGPAVVAGNRRDSLLYQRVASGEMPPGKNKLSAAELDILGRWIDAGAATARPEPENLPADTAALITDEERRHWSFQPVRRPPIPRTAESERVTSPVDAFVLSELEARGLSFGAAADRATLIRRLSFDLTGLPPAPELVERFVADPSDDAWNQLVELLLASPACGERWARHWLDVAGYADSDGYTEQDRPRSWAWRYRDYVIRSLNADKPWDQFLTEQLAGDELLPPAQDLTPAQADQLIATGFLRMSPDGTADGSTDQSVARNDVVADTIRVVSTSILGLTVGCAQCHEHRFDPIAQSDYYRLRALFEPALDWQNWRAPDSRLVSLWNSDQRAAAAGVDAELQEIAVQKTAELDSIVSATFERELTKLPAGLQPVARHARQTPETSRTPEQQQLIREYPFLNVDRGSVYLYLPDRLSEFNTRWDQKTAETQRKRPAEYLVMCLTEVPGQIPVTRLFSRGDFRSPLQEIAPGELTILNTTGISIPEDDPDLPTTGRRLAYARHLTGGQHPLTARVLVNRCWMHFFGQGLVTTPSDFGIRGARASHPDLLDWLATDFMDGGWSLRRLQRLIVTSTAYRQTSARRPALDAVDPDNRLLGRMAVRRLEAEAIRDALLCVSGQLNQKLFGPAVPVSPDDVGQIVLAVDTRDSAGRPTGKVIPLGAEVFRRSIYVQVRRSMPLGVLEPFDLPAMTPNCERRHSSTSPPQSLMMMNNLFVRQTADALAGRVRARSGPEAADQVTLIWQLVFGRRPSAADTAAALDFLQQAVADPGDAAGADAAQERALSHLCQALLCSSGFLYVD